MPPTYRFRNSSTFDDRIREMADSEPLTDFRVHPKEHPKLRKTLNDSALHCAGLSLVEDGRILF